MELIHNALMQKGKKKKKDEDLLFELEQLKKSKILLSRSKDLWSEEQKTLMDALFEKYSKLKTTYELAQDFKKCYDKKTQQMAI